MGHRDAELRHNFLQGFRLGQASVEACGEPFPQVAWHGTNSGDAPDQQLMPSTELKLLVAPPSADLRAFAAFADERDLTVLLSYQCGQSLDTLRGLEGRERLWPLVPSLPGGSQGDGGGGDGGRLGTGDGGRRPFCP